MSYHVLIVDDQRVVSRLLRSALETIEQGLIVDETPSGEEAILEASRIKIDLFIVDYRLPGITGVELVNKLRSLRPGCKVIMVSGVTDPAMIKQITALGADAFFQKPVPIGEFLEAVEKCLGLTRTVLPQGQAGRQIGAGQTSERAGLGGLLVSLRSRMNAEAVLLLDDLGRVVAQAGEMPGPDKNAALFSALVGLLSSAQKAAVLIDHTQRHLHVFGAEGPGGIFLPVGPAHALLMVGNGISAPRTLPARLELVFKTCQELLVELKNIGLPLEPATTPAEPVAASTEVPTRAEDLPADFLNILNQIGKKTGDADSFWESAVEKGTTFTEPDKLTYEQASRLGLTPDSAQDK